MARLLREPVEPAGGDRRVQQPGRRDTDATMSEVVEAIQELHSQMKELTEVTGEIKGILDTINGLKALGHVIKWLAAVAAACGVLWLVFKNAVSTAVR